MARLWPRRCGAHVDLVDRHLALLAPHLDHQDPWQRLAAGIAHDRLDESRRMFEAGDHLFDVSHMASSFESVRSVFDVMPTNTAEAWEAIVTRLDTVDQALAGYRAKLELAVAEGKVAAVRQVRSLAAQADELAGPQSAYLGLIPQARGAGFDDMVSRLEAAVGRARSAVGEFGSFLRRDYLPAAPRPTASARTGTAGRPTDSSAWISTRWRSTSGDGTSSPPSGPR